MKKSRKEKLASEERRLKTLSGLYSLSSVIDQAKESSGLKITQSANDKVLAGSEKDFSFLAKDLVKILLFVILAIAAQLGIKFFFNG